MALPRVFILGGGKLGSALSRALKAAGYPVTLRPMREGLPPRRIGADLIVLAIRDRDIAPTAAELVSRALIGHKRAAVVHCAGALGPDALAAARGPNVAVAQMHPMISFADRAFTPSLLRGQLLVDGDPMAARVARALGRRLGMTPRTIPGLDKVAYHAAAGIVANGAAALAAGGVALFERAGVSGPTAAAMLGPLLRSVAENVERLGLPEALTGPVRRGDAVGVENHLATLARLAPELMPIYLAAVRLQLPLARALGEAKAEGFTAIEEVLTKAG